MKDLFIKPTINDLAREAGVSLATVDRVMNNRPGVRDATIMRVRHAVEKLGYVRNTAAASLARSRFLHFLFILPDHRDDAFCLELTRRLHDYEATMIWQCLHLTILKAPNFEPQTIKKWVTDIVPDRIDGVALFAPETPPVRDAIDHIRARGIATVALVSDQPSSTRDYFIGIDNVAAGRTAARLITRFHPHRQGRLLVITGARLERNHLERRFGFDCVVRETSSGFTVLPTVEMKRMGKDPQEIHKALAHIFRRDRDISGIYVSGGLGPDLAACLRHLKQTHAHHRKMMIVAHELTPLSRQALEDGTLDAVISQNQEDLIRNTIDVLRTKVDETSAHLADNHLRIDIFLKDNMPLP
ncbi:MAG: LacI family DNA-binding transcriptional regulator [Pseudomonadota bacterium]